MKGFVRKNMTKSGCFLVFRMGAITKWRDSKIDNNTMKHLKAVMLVEPQFKYPESQQKRDCATQWKILRGFWKARESKI